MADRTSYVLPDMENALAEDVTFNTQPTNPISTVTEIVTIDIVVSGGGGIKKSG